MCIAAETAARGYYGAPLTWFGSRCRAQKRGEVAPGGAKDGLVEHPMKRHFGLKTSTSPSSWGEKWGERLGSLRAQAPLYDEVVVRRRM